MAKLSVVVPAYNESANLPLLYERLERVLGATGMEWECVIIDDHSADETFSVIAELARRDPRVRGARLARNHGSHLALAYGLQQATGDCAVVLAADLQDPPETIPQLLEQWRAGSQVVWAVRAGREGESRSTLLFARLYYAMMRHLVGMKQMPATGADFVLIDRVVIDALNQFEEKNLSIMALLMWMGFRQSSISYVKQARAHGQSGWSLAKKLKLVVDSVIAFSGFPIRVMSWSGLVIGLTGLVGAMVLLVGALSGQEISGWAVVLAALLSLGGAQMAMMGMLGEYLWRTLDECRPRPRILIEQTTAPRVEDSSR